MDYLLTTPTNGNFFEIVTNYILKNKNNKNKILVSESVPDYINKITTKLNIYKISEIQSTISLEKKSVTKNITINIKDEEYSINNIKLLKKQIKKIYLVF